LGKPVLERVGKTSPACHLGWKGEARFTVVAEVNRKVGKGIYESMASPYC